MTYKHRQDMEGATAIFRMSVCDKNEHLNFDSLRLMCQANFKFTPILI